MGNTSRAIANGQGSKQTNKRIRWAAILAALFVIELICSRLSYYTLGLVSSAFSVLISVLTVPVAFLYLRKFRRYELAIIIIIAALVIPTQVPLTVRRLALQAESENIVAYLAQTKAVTGQYPADLAGYSFRDPSLSPSIHYLTKQQELMMEPDFLLSYCTLGGDCTSGYWYIADRGWFYEDD